MKKLLFALLVLSVFTVNAQVPSYVPTNGLVAYYPFNGNANDASGNGNNGVVNGATLTSDRNGSVNSAYSFNGVSNYISVGDNATLNPNSISISGWINSNSNASDVQTGAKAIIKKWNQSINCSGDGANYNLQLSNYNSTNIFACATSRNDQIATALKSTSDLIGLNTWKHFVFVHDPVVG